jgi:hypothetical protein
MELMSVRGGTEHGLRRTSFALALHHRWIRSGFLLWLKLPLQNVSATMLENDDP